MELQPNELETIIKAYRLNNLDFIGFERVMPDDIAYYFCDKDKKLFILIASDYVAWGCGNDEPPETIQYSYYADHERNFPVKKWLTLHNGLNKNDESGDFEGYIYWASNGDRCTMAEIAGKLTDFQLNNLEKEIPYRAKTDIAIHAKRMIMAETISAVPRPSYQNEEHLNRNIRNAILDDLKHIAKYFINLGVSDIKINDIKNLNRDAYLYALEWDEYVHDEHEIQKEIVAINNQSWLALCELREESSAKKEIKKLLKIFENFLNLY